MRQAATIDIAGSLSPSWRRTSALDATEIAWWRDHVAHHPVQRLYFEAALDALAQGTDNRAFLIGRARRGGIQAIAFDSMTIATLSGEMDADEVSTVLDPDGAVEIHAPPHLAELVHERAGVRVQRTVTFRYYVWEPVSRPRPDPRCRRLTPADLPLVAPFFADYGDAIFSAWMLEQPFVGLFEDGVLAAVAGTVVAAPRLGSANLGNFLTAPERRGRGLARAVAHSLAAELWDRGIRSLNLGTYAENVAACRSYEAVGFRVLRDVVQLSLRRPAD